MTGESLSPRLVARARFALLIDSGHERNVPRVKAGERTKWLSLEALLRQGCYRLDWQTARPARPPLQSRREVRSGRVRLLLRAYDEG